MRYMSIPRPPEPHISSKEHFPAQPLSPAQQEAQKQLRAKAPTRRRSLATRCEASAEPTAGRIALGFAAGFAVGLIVLTFLIAPGSVRGDFVPPTAILGAAVMGLLGACFFRRD